MNRHVVTLPDGTEGKRSSAGRTYSHCIAVLDKAETLAKVIEQSLGYYRDHAEPSDQISQALAERNAAKVAELEERLANVADRWKVITWCGRLDLAEKQLNSAAARYHDEARILPVVRW